MMAALDYLQQAVLHLWLRLRLSWVEADMRSVEGRMAVAEMELEFLPQQLDAYKAVADDLRTQLTATRWGL